MSATSRRDFLRRALLAGTAVPALGSGALLRGVPAADAPKKRSPNERLNIASIGTQARAAANLKGVASENVVALCDIDAHRLAAAARQYPGAKTYKDFRACLEHPGLDGVVVSTPDHMHAIPAVQAMKAGFDVYVEKPLAHSVHEVRTMRETARKLGRVTQMGTQIHAGDNYRRAVEIVRSGVLGDIERVHVWMGGTPALRSIDGWPADLPVEPRRSTKSVPPSHIDYDLWLGPAPERPFHFSSFHFNWRYWWDFGGGVLGDFGCHFMDLPHWALDLRAPETIEAKGQKKTSGDNQVPDQMQVDYRYPARGAKPGVHLTWYHGGWMPEGAGEYGRSSAVLFEGKNGRLVSDYGSHKLYLDREVADAAQQIERIPASIGHHQEWIRAVKTRGPTTCDFDYSGALAETVLLGNVAYRVGHRLEWDDEKLLATNCQEAGRYIRREYRKGWSLG